MLFLIAAGTVVLYILAGTYSGQDAICLSGITAGVIVGAWYGKTKGTNTVIPILISSFTLSLTLACVSLILSHASQDYVESLAFFSVGFSLLFSYVLGLLQGKHLTNKST